ncbi:MAG: TauD/TfdA family dioxygenase [Deltaproteobacteria bacterium]|jgi:taurine dioxygenase|nr:TauD/TfdA family dioxygenase [Deltaproteobacteria bacterium]
MELDVAVDPPARSPALGLTIPPSSPLRFQPLPDSAFGLEVRGVDWGDSSPTTVGLLRAALRRHLLVVLRGQPSPGEEELDHWLRAFGRLVLDTEEGRLHYSGHRHLRGPASTLAIEMRDYQRRSDDNRGSTYYDPRESGASALVWHNDQSHRPMLKVLSVLEGIEVDAGAVPTWFRDTYTAYELLPFDLRAELEHRQLVFLDPRLPPPSELPRTADAMHPVFTPHPHSGRRSIFVNDFTDRVAGLDRAESDDVLARVRRHLDEWAPQYAHHWCQGDLLLWDNIGLQHRRDAVAPGGRRTIRQHSGLAE